MTSGFVEHLAADTSIEVEMFDPFRTLEVSEKHHDIDYLKRFASKAAICMGLASRRVDDK